MCDSCRFKVRIETLPQRTVPGARGGGEGCANGGKHRDGDVDDLLPDFLLHSFSIHN